MMRIHRNPVSWLLLVVLAATLFVAISFNRGFRQPPTRHRRHTWGPGHYGPPRSTLRGKVGRPVMVEFYARTFPNENWVTFSELVWNLGMPKFDGLSSNFPFFHGWWVWVPFTRSWGVALLWWSEKAIWWVYPIFIHTHMPVESRSWLWRCSRIISFPSSWPWLWIHQNKQNYWTMRRLAGCTQMYSMTFGPFSWNMLECFMSQRWIHKKLTFAILLTLNIIQYIPPGFWLGCSQYHVGKGSHL